MILFWVHVVLDEGQPVETVSVGPPHPLTMGPTAMGFLWIFFRRDDLGVLFGVFYHNT